MINLLPPEEKKELALQDKEKIVTIFSLVVLLFLFFLILVLIPVWLRVSFALNSGKINLNQAQKEFQALSLNDAENTVLKHNTTLGKLDKFYKNQTGMSGVLQELNRISLPAGLYFTGINFSRPENSKIRVSVSGFAKNRDNILTLKDSLDKDKNFKNVLFSSSSWITPIDADFNFTLVSASNANQK
jgi:Tfp pilus assembly protein PilN